MLALIAVMAFAVPAVAQDTSAVNLPVKWSIGDTHRIEMTRETVRVHGGSQHSAGQAVTPVTIRVLRRLDDGYVIRWTYGRTRFTGAKPSALGDKLANLTENLRLALRTDRHGAVIGLENREQIRDHYKTAGDAVIDWMLQHDQPDSVVNGVDAMLQKLRTAESVEATATRESTLFFRAFGGTYRKGAPRAFDDLLPNPWGHVPIPARARLFLQNHDKQAGIAVIGWKQVIDRDRAGPVLTETLRALGMPIPKDGNVFTGFGINEDGLWIFDTKTGWMLSGSWQRATTFNGNLTSVERIKFRTVD